MKQKTYTKRECKIFKSIWQTTQQSRTAIKVYVISGTTFSFEYSFRGHFETVINSFTYGSGKVIFIKNN